MSTARRGRFLTGSTMGHVVRMTMTGAFGITFVFLVDAANLFWVSQLGEPQLVAAIGFAFAIQFFSVSAGVGLMIAATVLISRAIGEGKRDRARHEATASAIIAAVVQLMVAFLILGFRHELLAIMGAAGETARLAARYLLITLPSLGFMAVGMVASGALRAEGDGRRAMFVTLTSGSVSMFVDPLLIIVLGLGLDGAALGLVISRIVLIGMALRFAIFTHNLLALPSLRAVKMIWRRFFTIALPAIATQMSTPFGNALLTGVIAGFGDSAVAAWAVVSRLTVLAFGGIFSLSGAIGGIFGQNYGARQYDRLRTTYRDALIFCAVYTTAVWLLLVLATPVVITGFSLDARGAEVLRAFTHIGAGAFMLTGALFVANACFNSLDRPLFSTLSNWSRDGLVIFPAAIWMSGIFGAPGVVYAQAVAGGVIGALVAFWGWRYTASLGSAPGPSASR